MWNYLLVILANLHILLSELSYKKTKKVITEEWDIISITKDAGDPNQTWVTAFWFLNEI